MSFAGYDISNSPRLESNKINQAAGGVNIIAVSNVRIAFLVLTVRIDVFFDLPQIFADNRYIKKETENITKQTENDKGTK